MISGINKSYINSVHNSVRGFGIKMPYVPQMRTKGQCKISEKELIDKIVKLAQRDAAAGKDSQFGATLKGSTVRMPTAEWIKLRDDFVSPVSPDRMNIINNTLSSYAMKLNSNLTGKDSRLSFFELLFNNSKRLGPDVGGNYVDFRDENGEWIARYSEPNGWVSWPTDAECARSDVFSQLWKDALAQAKAELEEEPEVTKGVSKEEIEMSFLV